MAEQKTAKLASSFYNEKNVMYQGDECRFVVKCELPTELSWDKITIVSASITAKREDDGGYSSSTAEKSHLYYAASPSTSYASAISHVNVTWSGKYSASFTKDITSQVKLAQTNNKTTFYIIGKQYEKQTTSYITYNFASVGVTLTYTLNRDYNPSITLPTLGNIQGTTVKSYSGFFTTNTVCNDNGLQSDVDTKYKGTITLRIYKGASTTPTKFSYDLFSGKTTTGTNSSIVSDFDISNSYTFDKTYSYKFSLQYDITYTEISSTTPAPTGTVSTGELFLSDTLQSEQIPLNLGRYGNGVAIGKYSSNNSNSNAKGLFECDWPAQFNDGISLNSGSLAVKTETISLTTSFADAYFYELPTSGMYIINVSITGVSNNYLNELLLKVATDKTQNDDDRTTIGAINASGRISVSGMYYADTANKIVVVRVKSASADDAANMKLQILKL